MMCKLSGLCCVVVMLGCSGPAKRTSPPPERRVVARTPNTARRPPPRPRARRAARPGPGMHTIKGYRLEVLCVPERTTFMVGEPIYVTFKVYNHSKEYLQIYDGGDTANPLGRASTYQVRVRTAGGALLPLRDAGKPKKTWAYPKRMLPDDGYSRELFLPNWVQIKRPGRYEITCSRVLHVDKHNAKKHRPKKGETGVRVTPRAKVTVTAASAAKMGKLISELAEILHGTTWASIPKAAKALAAINDPRIVPQFVKALKRNRWNTNHIAAKVFGRFNTKAALEGLKLCKEHRTVTVRRACAKSLVVSPHPKAWGLLLSMSDDEDTEVRHTVLEALGKKGCGKKVLKRIRKLAADDVSRIKNTADKYLKRCKRRRP